MNLDVVETFIALASLNTPARREAPVAAYLLEKLALLGVEAFVDDSASRTGSDTGNIIARLPGTVPGPTVLLCCHMDTVGPTPGLTPVVEGGIIRSNGETILGADDKAGIAVILAVLAQLKAAGGSHGGIEVVFTVQEEVGLFGAKALRERLTADFGYVLDGDGDVGTIINEAPSKVDLDFTLEGKAAHAGMSPELGANAIVAAAKAIAGFRSGRIDAQTTSNVGVISGGQARNIVADRAEVAVEVRSTDPAKLACQEALVLEAFERAAELGGVKLSVQRDVPFESFTVDETHPAVANAWRVAEALNVRPVLRASGGGMDANVFNARGLPCVGLGIGMEEPHSPQERIAVAQLHLAVSFLKALLHEAVKAAGDERP